MNKNSLLLFILIAIAFLTGCRTTVKSTSNYYVPKPRPVQVDEVEVIATEFYGRPDVSAIIRGSLSSNAAQMTDSNQYREGNNLYVEVSEITPAGERPNNRLPAPPFQTRIPLEILGILPGQECVVNVNGVEKTFIVPEVQEEIKIPEPPSELELRNAMNYIDEHASGIAH